MDAFSWLHLTDLHWGQTGQKPLWPSVRTAFFDDLAKLHAKCGPWQAVLFTGDLVMRGEEFDDMQQKVLEPLWQRLRELGPEPVLLAVPGNHDLRRPKQDPPDPEVRLLLREDGFREIAEDEFWPTPDSPYRKVIADAFANYRVWWDERPYRSRLQINQGLLPGDFSTTIKTAGGRSIGILGLNTTFLQLSADDYQRRLSWDVRQFDESCAPEDRVAWTEKHDVCLLMTHQGPDWLDDPSRTKIYPEINPAGRFAVHLFGHMHEEVIRGESYGGGKVLRKWQGPSLFGLEHYGDDNTEDRRHGYCAGTLKFEEHAVLLRHWPREAKFDQNGWRFVPDHEQCVLDDDGGTEEERIELRSRDGATPPGPGPTRQEFDNVMAQALEGYHRKVQQTWDARWSRVVRGGDDE